MRAILFPFVALALIVPAASADGSPPAPVFRAGAFAQDVTPEKFPVSVNGGMQDRLAKGSHDRLHARCLVLDDGTTRVALVVVDSCMIPRDIMDEAKRLAEQATGIPVARMLIAATHTHTAPTVAGVFQSDPDTDYVKLLPKRIAAGIAQANTNLKPARVGWAIGRDPTQVFNRRWKKRPGTVPPDPFGGTADRVQMNPGYQAAGLVEPAGPTDPEIPILAVQDLNGKPVALLANYALHYVGGVEPLSADYFGAFAERVGQLIEAPPGFVGVMSNGASGDCNNVNFAGAAPGKRQPFEQIRVVADSVAKATAAAHVRILYREDATIKTAETEIELGVRKPTEADLARARDILARSPVLKTLPEVYARETVKLADYPATVRVKLQAIRIGEMAIVSSPCETFCEIGLEIKKKSPFKATMLIELANGYNGYLPTPEQHKLGGYETWRARSSYLEVDASTKITEALLGLLEKVK
jgi:hypothetical protein